MTKQRDFIREKILKQKLAKVSDRKTISRSKLNETLPQNSMVDVFDTKIKKWRGPFRLIASGNQETNDSNKHYILIGQRVLIRNKIHVRDHKFQQLPSKFQCLFENYLENSICFSSHDDKFTSFSCFVNDAHLGADSYSQQQTFIVEEDGSDP